MAKSDNVSGAELSFCMIVKDEEEFLRACLESIEEIVDEIIIVDTGSTDGTLEIAEEFGARIIETPWVDDFSAVRNVGFEAAAGDWILWLDADEVLEEGSGGAIREAIRDTELLAYQLTIVNLQGEAAQQATQQSFPSPRLVRNLPEHRFEGIVHEQIQFDETKSGSIGQLPVRVIHFGYLDPVKDDRDKLLRNQELLSKSGADDPQSLVLAADMQMGAGEVDEALAKYEQAFEALGERDPMNLPGVVLKIIYGYRMKKDSESAFKWIDKGLKNWPDYTDLEYLRGLTHMESAEYPEAVTSFTACVLMGGAPSTYDSQPGVGDSRAWQGLGLAYVGLSNEYIAIRAFTQALQLDPSDGMSAGNLGEIYLNSGLKTEVVRAELEKLTDQDSPGIKMAFKGLFGE